MTQKENRWLRALLLWRVKHVQDRHFIPVLSVLIGLFSGLVAVTLKNTTHLVQTLVKSPAIAPYNDVFYFAFPLLGLLLTVWFVRRMLPEPLGDGIPSTLHSISRKNGFIRPFKMYGSLIASAFTVGFGGSVGLEGPTVSTGSAVGSNVARWFHLNYRQRILLIGCATSGALASILQAPIMAIVFTIEVFALDLTFSSLIPLLLASAAGALTSIFFQGDGYLFPVQLTEAFEVWHTPFYLVLAVVAGLASLYFSKMYFALERWFSKLAQPVVRAVVGGSLLGLVVFVVPPLYGEGYETINHLLNGRADLVVDNRLNWFDFLTPATGVLILLAGLVVLKIVATGLTFGAGGVGGIFAPTLFMGAVLGNLLAKLLNLAFPELALPEAHFTLMGMSGLLAGVLHTPLTAIFLIAEVTGGYQLFLPLMLTTALTFAVVKSFQSHSVYTWQLAKKGELISHDRDQTVLNLIRKEELIETDFSPVSREMTLGELVKVVASCKRNLFPVLGPANELQGVLTLDDFRQLMFDTTRYDDITVGDLMSSPPAKILMDEPMEQAMQKFQQTGAWNLPVLHEDRYIGFISKSNLFNVYRKKLRDFSGDQG